MWQSLPKYPSWYRTENCAAPRELAGSGLLLRARLDLARLPSYFRRVSCSKLWLWGHCDAWRTLWDLFSFLLSWPWRLQARFTALVLGTKWKIQKVRRTKRFVYCLVFSRSSTQSQDFCRYLFTSTAELHTQSKILVSRRMLSLLCQCSSKDLQWGNRKPIRSCK